MIIHIISLAIATLLCFRGLLLPDVVTNEFGIKLTDYGKLGAGIYFGTKTQTSLKYTSSSNCGFRYLLVCDVACGRKLTVTEEKPDLIKAPDGYDSVLFTGGNKDGSNTHDEEMVVYDPSQVSIKYLVELKLKADSVKPSTTKMQNFLTEDNDGTENEDKCESQAEDLSKF